MARVTYRTRPAFLSRGLHDRNRCLWGGFVIECRKAVVYFAGDSGCAHFGEIGRRCPRIDLAPLPFGADEPRWFTRWLCYRIATPVVLMDFGPPPVPQPTEYIGGPDVGLQTQSGS